MTAASHHRRTLRIGTALFALTLLAAACGNDDDSSSTTAAATETTAAPATTAASTETTAAAGTETTVAASTETHGRGGTATTTAGTVAAPAVDEADAAQPTRPPARSRTSSSFDFAAAASIIDVIVAKEKGYFDQLCLDVELIPSFSTSNYPLVAAGTGPVLLGGQLHGDPQLHQGRRQLRGPRPTTARRRSRRSSPRRAAPRADRGAQGQDDRGQG